MCGAYRYTDLRLPLLVIVVALASVTGASAQIAETIGLVSAGSEAIKNIKDIIEAVNRPRSVILEVDNNTNFTFRRVSDHHDHGGWAKTPHSEILPKSFDVFGSQSKGGSVATGTEGRVSYTNSQGLNFTIKWDNPFAGGNSCGVSVSGPQADVYRVRATCGSGNQEAHMRYEIYRSDWRRLAGCARDIGVDGSGVAWIVGCTSGTGPGNFVIRRWKKEDKKWEAISGGAIRIAVEPGGIPWVRNSEGKIYRRSGATTNDSWGNPLAGCALDIGVDSMSRAWVTGCTDNTIHRKHLAETQWTSVDGGAVTIAVQDSGKPWVINASGEIYVRDKVPPDPNWPGE